MLAWSHVLCCLLGLALSSVVVAVAAQVSTKPEEIPLELCDRLPVVVVHVDNAAMHFLVDTAATSMLNLKSFSSGRSKQVRVSFWGGTALTSAREVSIPELALGSHRLQDLKLPAVDLSPISKACGCRIDGILGVDLLEKLGAIIDLRQHIASLAVPPPDISEMTRLEELRAAMDACVSAFNLAHEEELRACLDPEVVVYTPSGEHRGQEQVLKYLRQHFLSLTPHARFETKPHDLRLVGDTFWCDYDYSIDSPNIHIAGRGMMVGQKTLGTWRLLNMHNSTAEATPPLRPYH